MGKCKRKRRSSNSARKGAMMVLALVAVVLFSWRRTVSTHSAEAKLLGVETGFVAERKARDAAAGKKSLVRRLTSLNETGGKINLGTPCLQKIGDMHTCHPLSVLWKVVHQREIHLLFCTGSNEEIITGERGKFDPPHTCTTHVAPISGNRQCCCWEKSNKVLRGNNLLIEGPVRCLPTFICIGYELNIVGYY